MMQQSTGCGTAPAEFYWLCSYPLSPGSIVDAGNWGRILRSYALRAPPPQLAVALKEQVFECVRLRDFPTRPSRLAALFVVRDAATARAFRQSQQRDADLLYRVRPTAPDAVTFEGSLELCTLTGQETLARLEESAGRYWSGEQRGPAETLLGSPIRILARVA